MSVPIVASGSKTLGGIHFDCVFIAAASARRGTRGQRNGLVLALKNPLRFKKDRSGPNLCGSGPRRA